MGAAHSGDMGVGGGDGDHSGILWLGGAATGELCDGKTQYSGRKKQCAGRRMGFH
jgi:hypothetical protein